MFNPKQIIIFLLFILLMACDGGNSLNSLNGPKTGKVSGLMCDKIENIAAAREKDIFREALISKGHCMERSSWVKVEVVRTVMMPADGKYSQIIWPKDDKKYWVRTEEIRE